MRLKRINLLRNYMRPYNLWIKKSIDFIKQSNIGLEDLERMILEKSQKGLEQVEKFTARGLEKATDEKVKLRL